MAGRAAARRRRGGATRVAGARARRGAARRHRAARAAAACATARSGAAADGVAGGHRVVRQLDRLEHLVEGCGHVVVSVRFVPDRRGADHESFHGGHVGIQGALRRRPAWPSAPSPTGSSSAVDLDQRVRRRDRSTCAEPGARRSRRRAAPSGRRGSARRCAPRRSCRSACVAASPPTSAPVGDHAHHESAARTATRRP